MKQAFIIIVFLCYLNPALAQVQVQNHLPVKGKMAFKARLVPSVSESSGLLYIDGKLWTQNDSGGLAALYSIDTADGSILQAMFIDNFPNVDWEDITADSNFIYIGDFGNNAGMRRDLKVLKIAKRCITDAAVIHVTAEAISFSYTDQLAFQRNSKNNFDCEAIISAGNALYIFTKDRGDARTRVYALPKVPGVYSISPYSVFDVKGRVCGATYNSQSNELALIGYMASKANSFIWFFDDFQGDKFFSGNKKRIEIGSSSLLWKTEGITFKGKDRLFISCETLGNIPAAIYTFDLMRQ